MSNTWRDPFLLAVFLVLPDFSYGQDQLDFGMSTEKQVGADLKRQIPEGTSVEKATRLMVELGFACHYSSLQNSVGKSGSDVLIGAIQHYELFCRASFPYKYSKSILSRFVTRSWSITFPCVDDTIAEPYISVFGLGP